MGFFRKSDNAVPPPPKGEEDSTLDFDSLNGELDNLEKEIEETEATLTKIDSELRKLKK